MVDYVVTTLDDEAFDGGDLAAETADGNLSLREALGLANANPDADTIAFDGLLVPAGTLFLTNGNSPSTPTSRSPATPTAMASPTLSSMRGATRGCSASTVARRPSVG